MTLNNSNPMANLAISGGTLNMPSGGTVAIANFGNPGSTAISTGPLVVSNKLLLTGGAAATISGTNDFTFAQAAAA